jgi:hypothetical protein
MGAVSGKCAHQKRRRLPVRRFLLGVPGLWTAPAAALLGHLMAASGKMGEVARLARLVDAIGLDGQ